MWNSFPDSLISANNINTFKNTLDRFWANQELIDDHKSSLTRTGNRNFVYSSDVINFKFHYFNLRYLMAIEALAFTHFVTALFALLALCT